MRIFFASLFVVAACGGASSDPVEPAPKHEEQKEHEEHKEEHPELPPELHAFHDSLAPLWHDESPDRQAKTCAAAGELVGKSADVGQAAPPAGVDAAAWQTAVDRLLASTEQLQNVCAGDGDFAATFHEVHEAFHGLMELLPKAS